MCAAVLLQAQTKPPLTALQETYEQYKTALTTKYDEQQNVLDASLLPRLETLEERYIQKGDLDGVLAVRAARKQLDESLAAKTPYEPSDAPETPELRQLLADHTTAREAIADKQRDEFQLLNTKYTESLDKLKRRLVMEDKIDDAVAVQKEIEHIAALQPKIAKPKPDPFPPPSELPPIAVAPPVAKPVIDANKLLTSAELVDNIQELAGKPVRFYARLLNMERDSGKRVILTLENDIRIRQELLNLEPLFNTRNLRYDNLNLNQVYVYRIGNTFLFEATLTQTPNASAYSTFRNATIRGCDSQVARNYLDVKCQAPCPSMMREGPNACPYCK